MLTPLFYAINVVSGGDSDSTNEIQTISKTGLIITLSDGGGSVIDSVNVYEEGFGINIENNVISVDPSEVNTGGGSSGCGHYVGELWGGGIVFYVYNNGCSGLIASLHDLGNNGEGAIWGLNEVNLGGINLETLRWYDGQQNTESLITAGVAFNTAASLCYLYESAGYNDWYLPSVEEFVKLADEQIAVNAVLSNDDDSVSTGLEYSSLYSYWTSTYSVNLSWTFNMYRSGQSFNQAMTSNARNDIKRVRAIRNFDLTLCSDGIQNGNETGIDCGGDCVDCIISGDCDMELNFNDSLSYGTINDIDGNTYRTIVIGSQEWMAENLRTTRFNNLDPIPYVTRSQPWNLQTPAYSQPNLGICTYGRVYNWYAVVDDRNICPVGWHVPTDNEWKVLEIYLGMSQFEADSDGYDRGTDEGGKLKSLGPEWENPNDGATNESGFTAQPAGARIYPGTTWAGFNQDAEFWTATDLGGVGSITALYRDLEHDDSQINRGTPLKTRGISVRCIKD